MITRATSLEAYEEIKANGLLSKARWRIYRVLCEQGPMTASELFNYLETREGVKVNWNTRTRFTELRDLGVIAELEERKCRITGQRVIVWAPTCNLPLVSPLRKPVKHSPLDAAELQALVRLYSKGDPEERAALLRVVHQTHGRVIARKVAA